MPEHTDPLHDLEHFGSIAVNPLPPTEVRRLGDRRRARRRNGLIAAVAAVVVVIAVPVALNVTGSPDASRQISGRPTPSPTPAPTVITYRGSGVEIRSAADTAKLTGTTAAFKTFIAVAAAQATANHNACPGAAAVVTVQKYSSAGYAIGGVNDCGGYQALWAVDHDTGRWTEELGTQDTWDCDGLRYLGVPRSVAGDCFDYSGSFGPTEVDGLRLGMTKAQIQAAGGTLFGDPGAGCQSVRLPHSTQVTDQTEGFFSASHGLVVLTARPSDKTDKKVGLGSTEAKVKAAYPHGITEAYGHWVVPLANGSAYYIGFGDGIVNHMFLIGPHANTMNPVPECLG